MALKEFFAAQAMKFLKNHEIFIHHGKDKDSFNFYVLMELPAPRSLYNHKMHS